MFNERGVHVMVDGQYGSTGKGLFGAYLAEKAIMNDTRFDCVLSNAGPNSGHTFYHNGEKHVLKMLPTFAVASSLWGHVIPVYMTAGAVIDLEVLVNEARKYPNVPIAVNPRAALITNQDKESEHSGTVAAVAGTRTGTGAALARKVLRDPNAVIGALSHLQDAPEWPKNITIKEVNVNPVLDRLFMEISQGFSLGIHGHFYPKTTSRECTVSQGLADARLPPSALAKTYMVIRTFPIRVGNHEGYSSGDCYPDQKEISWEDIGVEPEKTTVTQRVRRVFTFSNKQLVESILANDPDVILVNFMNYLPEGDQQEFLNRVATITDSLRDSLWSTKSIDLYGGWGPESKDIVRIDKSVL